MSKISIIIPVYNAEKYLASTLESAISQTYTNLEIICVDDGSTDTSAGILQDYKNRDERIRVIGQKNGGGSAARNAGLDNASGDYVMFLDADDIYRESTVANAYDRASETGADIVFYNFARFVGAPSRLSITGKPTPGKDITLFTKNDYAERLFNDFAIITWNKLIKRSVITDNKLAFDTKLSHNHDVDFSVRLMLAANSFSYVDKVEYFYRTTDTGITATKRSDPTNVLKILINLNKYIEANHKDLKQSFDNYAVDMIVGTLIKYSDNVAAQKEVFEFASQTVVRTLGIDRRQDDYFYSNSMLRMLKLVKAGSYDEFVRRTNQPHKKLRKHARKMYDAMQGVLSRLMYNGNK